MIACTELDFYEKPWAYLARKFPDSVTNKNISVKSAKS